MARLQTGRYSRRRWLGEEPDPRDLMRPYSAELMRMWPISPRVNKPENDDAGIVEPVELAVSGLYHRSGPPTSRSWSRAF